MELAETNNGMVLVTGPAGSGKSTTLACIIDQINHEKEEHKMCIRDSPTVIIHPAADIFLDDTVYLQIRISADW